MSRPRPQGPSVRWRVREFGAADPQDREDRLVTEEPLEVRCGWPGTPAYRVGVTMRTPGDDFALAVGLLAGAGVLRSEGDLHTVAYCTDHALRREERANVVTVSLRHAPRVAPRPRSVGPASAGSACGVCGADSIDDVLALSAMAERAAEPDRSGPIGRGARSAGAAEMRVTPEVLRSLPDRLRASQRVFERTGGLHAAGLFTAAGDSLVTREDVGRHNAVDKVFGVRILAGEPTAAAVLAVSGRIGFEIVQKAVTAGVGVLAAVGAPTSLAVELAGRAGLCTVGFLSRDRFVAYSVPERVGV
jgi:FdhD protein